MTEAQRTWKESRNIKAQTLNFSKKLSNVLQTPADLITVKLTTIAEIIVNVTNVNVTTFTEISVSVTNVNV